MTSTKKTSTKSSKSKSSTTEDTEMKESKSNVENENKNGLNLDEYISTLKNRAHIFAKKIHLNPNSFIKEHQNSVFNYSGKEIEKQMKETYPIIHGSILHLIYEFIDIKCKFGSKIEQNFYKNKNLIDIINRIFCNRPVVFFTGGDSDLLRTGQSGSDEWASIGQDYEKSPRILKDYMSYDELLFSSTCGLSSFTKFINNGNRYNGRRKDKKNNYTKEGIYMGLVGSRFERDNCMEHIFMILSSGQNRQIFGYGKNNTSVKINPVWKMWNKFYNIPYLPEFKEIYNRKVAKNSKKKEIRHKYYQSQLQINNYKTRMRLTLELFFFDANLRCKNMNEKIVNEDCKNNSTNDSDINMKDKKNIIKGYLTVVGLGTGVWAIDKQLQDQYLVQITKDILDENSLEYISCINFSWFHPNACYVPRSDKKQLIFPTKTKDKIKNKEDLFYFYKNKNNKIIDIGFSKRNPADKLYGKYKNCLNIAMYAWDGNSFPGNEYWLGSLSASGDPAAACCSTIPYIQNSEINKEYINAKNAKIFFNSKNIIKLDKLLKENNKNEIINLSKKCIPKYTLDNINFIKDIELMNSNVLDSEENEENNENNKKKSNNFLDDYDSDAFNNYSDDNNNNNNYYTNEDGGVVSEEQIDEDDLYA